MFMLVSLSRVKAALRITHDDDDTTLEMLISAASLKVIAYLKGQASTYLAIDSPPESPPSDLDGVDDRIVAAVVIIVGILYREPDGDASNAFSHGNLPWMATALLYDMRDPTLA